MGIRTLINVELYTVERDNRTRAELSAIVNRLKWYLTDLSMMGITDWPQQPRQHKAPTSIGTADDSVRVHPEQALIAIREDLGECTRCRLHPSRTTIVFGEGSPQARLVFVGEGPGFDEDQQGRPFVGRAGRLLDKMIKALGRRREEVYICNVVKCRPPNNRTPLPDEIQTCSPFLFRQLEAIAPAVICALGACAAQTLLATTKPISSLRGKNHYWRGMPLVCIYHPAYLLRNASQKASAWQDLLLVHGILTGQKEGN
jgi:uracil-DNA glycosylase